MSRPGQRKFGQSIGDQRRDTAPSDVPAAIEDGQSLAIADIFVDPIFRSQRLAADREIAIDQAIEGSMRWDSRGKFNPEKFAEKVGQQRQPPLPGKPVFVPPVPVARPPVPAKPRREPAKALPPRSVAEGSMAAYTANPESNVKGPRAAKIVVPDAWNRFHRAPVHVDLTLAVASSLTPDAQRELLARRRAVADEQRRRTTGLHATAKKPNAKPRDRAAKSAKERSVAKQAMFVAALHYGRRTGNMDALLKETKPTDADYIQTRDTRIYTAKVAKAIEEGRLDADLDAMEWRAASQAMHNVLYGPAAVAAADDRLAAAAAAPETASRRAAMRAVVDETLRRAQQVKAAAAPRTPPANEPDSPTAAEEAARVAMEAPYAARYAAEREEMKRDPDAYWFKRNTEEDAEDEESRQWIRKLTGGKFHSVDDLFTPDGRGYVLPSPEVQRRIALKDPEALAWLVAKVRETTGESGDAAALTPAQKEAYSAEFDRLMDAEMARLDAEMRKMEEEDRADARDRARAQSPSRPAAAAFSGDGDAEDLHRERREARSPRAYHAADPAGGGDPEAFS